MTAPEILAAKRLIDQARRAQLKRNQGVEGALERLMNAPLHGVSAYRHGCRCDECKAARNAYERERIARKKQATTTASRPESVTGAGAARKEEPTT